jgi:hypothetical protein
VYEHGSVVMNPQAAYVDGNADVSNSGYDNVTKPKMSRLGSSNRLISGKREDESQKSKSKSKR